MAEHKFKKFMNNILVFEGENVLTPMLSPIQRRTFSSKDRFSNLFGALISQALDFVTISDEAWISGSGKKQVGKCVEREKQVAW